ncbi:MAG: PDZ domain-containing protein [Desulfobacterales bacterium]|nr:PDZ domain-containing protein [Desulfobacterales bacterium]
MISAKRYFILLNLALIAGAVYYSVQIFYKVVESRMAPARVSQTKSEPERLKNGKAASPYRSYKSIVQRDLFNTLTTAEQKKAPINVETLQPTKLNLKLWGTVAVESGQAAYAVIEDLKTRQQGLYRAGDPVVNATVQQILREKVILSVNGKDEILEMAQASTAETPVKPRRHNTAPGRKIALKRSLIDDASRDINRLLQQVQITPHAENGQPDGLLVTHIKPGSIFRKVGLRNGDVLQSVAGRKITSIDDMITLYQSLKTSDTIAVMVKRRNRLQKITYNIQ